MPYAKSSLRAEQRALRERMRVLGLDHQQIAAEFARRYALRPRAAWRYALGWSLKDAAEHINTYAAGAGLRPDGATVAMTGPHLCEYEAHPGYGAEPTGRRPTPYLLSLLARVYGCTVHNLLDLADYECMPPADRLILDQVSRRLGGNAQSPEAASPHGVPERPGDPHLALVSGVLHVRHRLRAVDRTSQVLAEVAPAAALGLPSPGSLGMVESWRALDHGLNAGLIPGLKLDEIQHLAAALENARRYADRDVARYFDRRLTAYAASDGARGPKQTLPLVLAAVAALEHTARDAKPPVRRELLRAGARGAEFAGWLYRDSAVPDLAAYWHDRAIEWAQVSGDQALQAYVLLKKGQAAWDTRDARRMLVLSQAVQAGPPELPARVRAEAVQQEARGLAMLGGDMGLIESKLGLARSLLAAEQPGTEGGSAVGTHYGAPLLAMQTAICYCEAGQPARSVEIYTEFLTSEAFSRRDYGYFRALGAAALAAAGRPDDAAAAGSEACAIAVATASGRTLAELSRLFGRLRPWQGRPAVLDFGAELAAALT
jgi:hypothetical protein